MPSKRNTDSNAQNLVLDTSDLVLTVVRDAARLAPIPYLQDAAGLALTIVNLIQGVKDNKDAFRRLASDACGLVYAILCRHTTADRTATDVSKDLLDNLQELLKTLASIEQFAKKKVARNMIMRLIMRKSDLGTIQEFRENLRHSLDLFGLKSNISIQEHLANIASQQGEILQAFQARNPPAASDQSEQSPLVQTNGTLNDSGPRARDTEGSDSDITRKSWHGAALASADTSMPRHPPSPLPNIHASRGNFTMSTVGRDQTTVDSSHHVSNTNSGNTTTTITRDSNNDSSVRITGPRRSGRRH